MAYKYFASGYLVLEGKVLLVHHNRFDKWVPPGGHFEEDETPDQTVEREFFEETSLKVEVLPAHPAVFQGDHNATPIPMPFYIDLEREDFDVPRIGFFYFVRQKDRSDRLEHQQAELKDAQWFEKKDLKELKTFDQVRAVASYALDNYPLK